MILKIFFILVCINRITAISWSGTDCDVETSTACYVFNNKELSYSNARMYCQSVGGKLAKIPNEETNRLLHRALNVFCQFRLLDKCKFWFGLHQIGSTSSTLYAYDNDETPDYTGWAISQPDLSDPNYGRYTGYKLCALIEQQDGLWYDFLCERHNYRSICEYEANPCDMKDINIPNAIYDGCFKSGYLTAGTDIKISCQKGYHLQGPKNVTCTGRGWTQNTTCKRHCPIPKIPPNSSQSKSSLSEFYFVGQKIVFLCNPGYQAENDPSRSFIEITCMNSGEWDIKKIKCIKPTNAKLMIKGVQEGKSLSLVCLVSESNNSKFKMQPLNQVLSKENWLWQRNSVSIINFEDYSIQENGTLHIKNFKIDKQGIYSCLNIKPFLAIGTISYDLRLLIPCDEYKNKFLKKNFKENEIVILNCPHPQNSVTKWFKNGIALNETSKITMVPDGSLLFNRVAFTDSGNYLCTIHDQMTPCSSNLTIQMDVQATAESICGNKDMIQTNPWTVSLWMRDENAPFCYGALIHEEWVLTSAYCLSGFNRKKSFNVYVHFGKDIDYNQENGNSSKTQNIQVTKIIIHPKYSQRLMANDVALMKLREQVHFSNSVQPICLSNQDLTTMPLCNQNSSIFGKVSGWGSLEASNSEGTVFESESMKIGSTDMCQRADMMKFSDAIICATGSDNKSSTFAGDVGSPFVTEHKNIVYLIGIFILGERYSNVGDYDYFTKVSKYVPWIQIQIREN